MFKAYGLYSHIRANRTALGLSARRLRRSASCADVLLRAADRGDERAARRAFRLHPGARWDDLKRGWPIGVIAAGVWFVIAYLFHQKMIDFATGAANLSRAESPRVYNLLEKSLHLSRRADFPPCSSSRATRSTPTLPGSKRDRYKIAVTRGLTRYLTDAELEAVLAHELTHIRNRDVQLLVIAVIFAGIFAFVADLTIRRWDFPFGFSPHRPESDNGRRGNGGAALAILIALFIIALGWRRLVLIRFALSRSREFLADAGSVELTKNPDAMISALRKIEAHAAIPNMPSRMQYFFIDKIAGAASGVRLAGDPSERRRACRGSRRIRRRPGRVGRGFRSRNARRSMRRARTRPPSCPRTEAIRSGRRAVPGAAPDADKRAPRGLEKRSFKSAVFWATPIFDVSLETSLRNIQ